MAGKDMINAFLGAGAVFEGQLEFKGMVRIDCAFTGAIHSDGTLVLGDKARVEGEITVEQLISNGIVIGNVTAKSKVTLQKNSQLQGNLTSPYLDVEEGAVLEGQVIMKRAAATPPSTPSQMAPMPAINTSAPEEELPDIPEENGESGGAKKKGWFKR